MRAPTLLIFTLAAVIAGPASAEPLTIERAIALSIERDERARIADEELAVAEAQVDRARAFFFPDVGLTGRYEYRGNPGMFQARNVWESTVGAGVRLFDGRGFPLLSAARLSRDASKLDRREVRRQVGFESAQAFLVTLGQQAVVEAATHRVDFARQSLSDASGRVEAQLNSSNDRTRARQELATAERELRRARGDLKVARLQLGYLLGIDVDTLAEPAELLAAAVAARPDESSRPDEGDRLDLAVGRLRARAADAQAREPLWRWVPSLALIGEASASSNEGTSGNTTEWFIGITAEWVLWDGGERVADRAELLARAKIADLELARQTRQAGLEVSTATAALVSARESAVAAAEAVEAARANVDETRTLYIGGLARSLDVADAGARLFDAEVELARDRYGLGVALLQLRAALGQTPAGAAEETSR